MNFQIPSTSVNILVESEVEFILSEMNLPWLDSPTECLERAPSPALDTIYTITLSMIQFNIPLFIVTAAYVSIYKRIQVKISLVSKIGGLQ